MEIINAVGRRKASVVRAFLRKGKGKITVNGKDYKDYFKIPMLQNQVTLPFEVIAVGGDYDITLNAKGGGTTGQAEAAKLAIARALVKINAEHKPALREKGLLTRDSRVVERKKPGLRKARKKSQFSKR
ncbi:MAG: 30S ribosomal protein S9 [Fimbriimonadaceae bacterium]|nr:30S ribosomal protein S9 [Chitinophagales bacterium]